jgi:AcrR family transcriptional regulator
MELLPRPASPKLRDRYDRKQQQIVRNAAKLFAERGYNQTTIQDLADATDLAAGGIYHYVTSQERLLAMICDQLMDPLLEQAHELLAIEGDAATQLREMVHLWVAHASEHRDHMLVFQQERHVLEQGAQWRAQTQSRKRFERLVEDVVKRVDAAGQLRLDDDRLALMALLGMVNHTPQWFRLPGRLSALDVADGYVDLLTDAGSGCRRSAGSGPTVREDGAHAQTSAP